MDKEDVFVFRPDTAGDYSSGTFILLLDAPAVDVRAITLVEEATTIGDKAVNAGDFLLAQSGPGDHDDIRLFSTTDVGAGTTSGTLAVLIDGLDMGYSDQVQGLELVETDTWIGGTTLLSGQIPFKAAERVYPMPRPPMRILSLDVV